MKQLLFLILLVTGFVNAQEKAFTISKPYRTQELNPKATFVIADEKTGNFAVFMISREVTHAFLHDKEFNLLKKIKAPKLASKFTSFQGYNIKDNTYTFLMNTPNNRSYGVLVFNFDTASFSTYETDFKLRDEKLLSTISHHDSCYLMTISKKEDEIIIYSFKDNWNEPIKKSIVFDGSYFKEETDKKYSFFELFHDKFRIKTISTDSPVSIKEAAGKIKIYSTGTHVQITSNIFSEKTFILDFDLIEDEKKLASYDMPEFEKEGFFPKSNSFLFDNTLFQVRANNLKMAFNIIDTKTSTVLNTLNAKKDIPISFKNGPIIHQTKSVVFEGKKNIKSTAAFFRKLQVMDLGIAVYKENNNYIFNLGGYYEENSGLLIMPGYGFIGGVISSVASSFLTYNYSKSLMIEGILDENLKHQKGSIKENIFTAIYEFAAPKKIKAGTLFEKDGIYYWGNYDAKQDVYTFYSFSN